MVLLSQHQPNELDTCEFNAIPREPRGYLICILKVAHACEYLFQQFTDRLCECFVLPVRVVVCECRDLFNFTFADLLLVRKLCKVNNTLFES